MGKVLAVYGSPRRSGNSEILLDHFLKRIDTSSWDIEHLYLRDMNFSYCTECGGCEKTGRCVLADDMELVYDKLLSYQRVLFALPLFFLGPPALAKAFIDRGQALWVRKYVLGHDPGRGHKRKGFIFSVCGFKGGDKLFSCNVSIVRAFFAACGIQLSGQLLISGVDHAGDIFQRLPSVDEKIRDLYDDFNRT